MVVLGGVAFLIKEAPLYAKVIVSTPASAQGFSAFVSHATLEVTQGLIPSKSPTDATRF